jgi:hypothetical protein
MRTPAEDQLKFIFENLVADSICGMDALKALSVSNGWIEDSETFDLLNHRSKLNLASSHGYISLSEAIQMFERPTAFKESLAGLSQIMEDDEDYLRYLSVQKEVDDLCHEWDLTYDEVTLSIPSLKKDYVNAQLAWFNRQAEIETIAYRLDGADPTAKPSGFNSVPMVQRPSAMDRIIRRHLDRRFTPEELTSGFTRIVDAEESWNDTHSDVTFIKRSRMPRLMTLQTPLRRLGETLFSTA